MHCKILSILLFQIWYLSQSTVWGKAPIQCIDESGKIVDWYVVYKFPKLAGGLEPLQSGHSYAFITSDTHTAGWTLSHNSIDDAKNSIFGHTLAPIYDANEKDISYVMYNDEPPHNTSIIKGTAHAKGVIVSGTDEGFWLIHSIPKFANDQSEHKFEYPTSGGRYGQTALCISVKSTEITKIIDQILFMEPDIYSMLITDDLAKKSSNANDLKNHKWKNSASHSNENTIISSGGVHFTSFSKTPDANKDLYADIVAPTLNTNLWVQTWRKNPGEPLSSECNLKYKAENVKHLQLHFVNSKDTGGFEYLDDHSKWAMSQEEAHPYVCIGDINRMHSQYKRGGGTTCIQSPLVWKSFKEWLGTDAIEKCQH